MALTLYAHPFSSYCQKVLIAFDEYEIDFDFRMLSPDNPDAISELEQLWPFGKFPVLVDDGEPLREATIIIEYLSLKYAKVNTLIPVDPMQALDVRFMDRFFDNYIATYQQKVVFNALRPEGQADPYGAEEARRMLDVAYGWLDQHMAEREWASGDHFSLADCSAAPQLFYADWTVPIGDRYPHVQAYRQRLNARPSFARCIEDARPYRAGFPLGVPDQD